MIYSAQNILKVFHSLYVFRKQPDHFQVLEHITSATYFMTGQTRNVSKFSGISSAA